MNVNRNVIADLWTLCTSGEASDDSKRLVDEFLAADPEFARTLREDSGPALPVPSIELPPDHEARTLDRTKRKLRRRSPLRILAVVLTALTVARLVEDTSFTTSPTRFIATGVVALVCWVLYGWHTRRLQESSLKEGP